MGNSESRIHRNDRVECEKMRNLYKIYSTKGSSGYHPKCIIYEDTSNDEQYVILEPHPNNDDSIYRLDIDADKYEKLCKYPDGFWPCAHGMILHPDKQEIHIFSNSCDEDEDTFAILNLQSLKWIIKENTKVQLLHSIHHGVGETNYKAPHIEEHSHNSYYQNEYIIKLWLLRISTKEWMRCDGVAETPNIQTCM